MLNYSKTYRITLINQDFVSLAVMSQSPSPALTIPKSEGERLCIIRDFPDHATFREKGAKLDCVDKLGVFLSLTLCIKANFDCIQRIKYDGLEKM